MATLTLTDEQVVDLVRQLPAERKRTVLQLLAPQSQRERDEQMDYAEQQLRRLCAERGIDWDALSEDEREAFIDDLVHEDRSWR